MKFKGYTYGFCANRGEYRSYETREEAEKNSTIERKILCEKENMEEMSEQSVFG